MGDDRPVLVFTALPGASLVFDQAGPLPRVLARALERGGPTPPALGPEHMFLGADLLPNDLVLAVRLRGPAGERVLLHQLFGSPGNTAVVERSGRVLWAHRQPLHPCLLEPLPAPPPEIPEAPDPSERFRDTGLPRLLRQRETALADRVRRSLQRRHAAARRLAANLAADLGGAERGGDHRRDAETLAAHLHTLTSGADTVVLEDPRDGTARTIALDPALPPAANLERLFKLARKADRGRHVIAERLGTATDDAAATEAALERLDACLAAADPPDPLARLENLLAFAAETATLPGDSESASRRAPDEPTRPFRRYRLAGHWDVWIGRSREENDELTLHASHPRDLWLHAQGVTGSHVIIRTGGKPEQVPRAIIEQAAQLAALHSRARHSTLVPVNWTQRRHVRKPRKAAPGAVVCQQEKTVFVAPGIPTGAEPI